MQSKLTLIALVTVGLLPLLADNSAVSAETAEAGGELRVESVILENAVEATPPTPTTSGTTQSDNHAAESQTSSGVTSTVAETLVKSGGPIEVLREVVEENQRLKKQLKNLQSAREIRTQETGHATVTLIGDPHVSNYGVLRFLRSDLEPPEYVHVLDLGQRPADAVPLGLTARWHDTRNLVRVDALPSKLGYLVAPIKGTEKPLQQQGVWLRVVRHDGAIIDGHLEAVRSETPPGGDPSQNTSGDPSDNASAETNTSKRLILRVGDKVEEIPLDRIREISVLPSDRPFEQLKRFAGARWSPNDRSIRIDWTNQPSSEDVRYVIRYHSSAPPWSMQYTIDIQDAKRATVTPRAFFYNRTAYDWNEIDVSLRDASSGIDYRLKDITLPSQRAGLFEIPGSWKADKVTPKKYFAASTMESGRAPHLSVKIEKLNSPALLPAPAAVLVSGLPVASVASFSTTATVELGELSKVRVTYQPKALALSTSNLKLGIGKIDGEMLYRTAPQTFQVSNSSASVHDIEIAPSTAPLKGNALEWKTRDKLKIKVAPSEKREGKITFAEPELPGAGINLRTAASKELKKVSLGPAPEFFRVRRIEMLRDEIEKAKKKSEVLAARQQEVDKALLAYRVVNSQRNRDARRRLHGQSRLLAKQILRLTARHDEAQEEIDYAIFDDVFRLSVPTGGRLYHGVFAPASSTDVATAKELESYQKTIKTQVAWVMTIYDFSASSNRSFSPKAFHDVTQWIVDAKRVPFIQLRLHEEKLQDAGSYTLQEIIDGDFDDRLVDFGNAVRDLQVPVMIEFGPKCDGFWNSWSGIYNGGGRCDGYGNTELPDGPERFRDAYRRVIDVIRHAGAANVTWVFHVDGDDNSSDKANASWNRLESYYPGPSYIDWIGVSLYGLQDPGAEFPALSFSEQLDKVYPRLLKLAPSKPVIIAESGSTSVDSTAAELQPQHWLGEALMSLLETNEWKNVIGFAWRNEKWQNDEGMITNMRVQDNRELGKVFAAMLGKYARRIQQSPEVIIRHSCKIQ